LVHTMRANKVVRVPLWDGSEACSGIGVDIFYDDSRKNVYQGREHREALTAICLSCPRLNECSEYAIKHEQYGFWAGMTEDQRHEYRKKNKITLVRPEMYSDCLPDFKRGA